MDNELHPHASHTMIFVCLLCALSLFLSSAGPPYRGRWRGGAKPSRTQASPGEPNRAQASSADIRQTVEHKYFDVNIMRREDDGLPGSHYALASGSHCPNTTGNFGSGSGDTTGPMRLTCQSTP